MIYAHGGEVKRMAEYLDKNLAVKELENLRQYYEMHDDCDEMVAKKCKDAVSSLPVSDVAPVVHSKWGEYEVFPFAPSLNGYPCGNCGMHFSASSVPILKYCPNCGARMDL